MKPIVYLCLLAGMLVASPLASAGTKEELVRLQSDVLALQNQIREFDKNYSDKLDGIKSLVVQLNDQVAKSNLLLDRIAANLENQASGRRTTDDALSQDVRKLSEKMDEAGTRISAMAQQINDLRVQSNSLNAPGTGLSPEALYAQAFNDFVQGNFDLAIAGFTAYVATYPAADKAPDALLNMGDAYSGQKKLPQAVASFTRIINEYPDSEKMPSALYKRAKVELDMQDREYAIADLRNIIEKYPQTPESDLAKTELENLGVTKPAAPAGRRKR